MTNKLVVARPRKIAIYGAIAATAVLATMIVIGLILNHGSNGPLFRIADQVGLMSVGVFGAAAIMLVARPRLRADESGLAVRNILGETFFPWSDIVRIAFPAGAHWAQVVLPDDETHPILAIQTLDQQRAVEALRAVREIYQAHRPERPTRSPEEVEQERRRIQAETAAAASRQLGRLEIIDRKKAGLPIPDGHSSRTISDR